MNRAPSLQNATTRAFSWGVPAQFAALGALFVLIAGPVGVGLAGQSAMLGVVIALGFYLLALGVALRGLRHYPHGSIGLCNGVTMLRLALVSALIAPLFVAAPSAWPIFAIASVALALDGLDGWLARRDGMVSAFGASFDMEVDAVLALVLALHAFLAGHVGAFILVLGLPRYLFWLAQFAAPWLVAELPDRFSRKIVCVVQIAVLIAVLAPGIGRPLTDVVAGMAAGALIWSFWVDVAWLWRGRT